MSDNEYQNALDEYRQAKAQLTQWVGRYGPAAEVEAAERRFDLAAHHLAEVVEREGR